jgi:superfamily II RNA helicase
MVKICSYEYPKENESDYQNFYVNYPYNLHDFQKWSIQSIVTGNHLLVCCPTGSGKTFSGEFALSYFHNKGKKSIYTTPIKALSNEKFHNFTEKYPQISIGLITGDIKTNPDADILIMTTEILLNKLYQIRSNTVTNSSVSFDMDILNDLGCVVFDEIHMINDENRGSVWEQCIMMMPEHVQMVGLSATLYQPENFALWMENKGNLLQNDNHKEVYLTRKLKRAVPLTHYSFITTNSGIFKTIKDKQVQDEIKAYVNHTHILQNHNGQFNEVEYNKMKKMLALFEKHKIFIKRQHVLNMLCKHLVNKEMLPALCYVFSRKQLEKCAHEITTNLLEFDSKNPYTVDRECEQIIRKLPNYQEYLNLPEYINVVELLRKGIGIHHAGMMPILREMTEIMFARGFVKLLFCTETMSVGINLPVKTTIFTDVNKFNGTHLRILHGHEYTQAAGRAGRLGLDSVGHVIHLNNLFRNVNIISYKNMMKGDPQKLVSKFKISYNLLLNLVDIKNQDFAQFVNKSMIKENVNESINSVLLEKQEIENKITQKQQSSCYLKTPISLIEQYIEMSKNRLSSVNKKRKQIEREMSSLKAENISIEMDAKDYNIIFELKEKKLVLENEINSISNYLNNGVNYVIKLLQNERFIEVENDEFKLTTKGQIANHLNEVHCLVFAELIENNVLTNLNATELIMVFSCFTNVNVPEDKRSINNDYKSLGLILNNSIKSNFDKYMEIESYSNFKTGMDYKMHYDLMPYMEEWIDAKSEEDCKMILQRAEQEKDIFLGDFIKALLKINNIVFEMETIAQIIGNIPFLYELNQIRSLTLKYVVTNQSLYV